MNASHNRRTSQNQSAGLSAGKLLLIGLVLILGLMAFLCYFLFGNVRNDLVLEAGSLLEADDFLVMDWGVSAKIMSDIDEVDTACPGDYIVKVRYHGSDFYPTLHIKDTMSPVVTVQDLTIYTAVLPDPADFIAQAQDGTPVSVTYVQQPDMSLTGEQEVQLCVTDAGGNAVFTTAKLTNTPDTAAPQILGTKKITVYQGSTVSYRSDVIVQDDVDPAPQLVIDSQAVDLSTPGTYDLVYRAADAAGNMASVETTVTVVKKPSSFVEEASVYAKADELLDQIVTDGMTDLEKVEAIYEWVKDHCTYVSSGDTRDRLQSAYTMMTKYRGDCYHFYAICSVLFERLGFPNMEVKRSENSVRNWSTHFWNLVSIDGGKTYYHLDTCPQTGFDVRICMATDAQLEACHQYTPGYYTMDEGKYPATPLE